MGKLKVYLKSSFGHLVSTPGHSVIKLFGLITAITVLLVVAVYINFENSYDKFHKDYNRIYRITTQGKIGDDEFHIATASEVTADNLKRDFNEVLAATNIFDFGKGFITKSDGTAFITINKGSNAALFDVFSFEIIEGDTKRLDEPNKAVITESTAKKFFPNENPIGQILKMAIDRQLMPFEVIAVVEDVPKNSHFTFDFLFSNKSVSWYQQNMGNWLGNTSYATYIKTGENVNVTEFEKKVNGYLYKQIAPIIQQWQGISLNEWLNNNNYWQHHLQPLSQIHLHSNLGNEIGVNGDIQYLKLFSIIALLVILISCINYAILAIVDSLKRKTELGVRRLSGAKSNNIAMHIFFDSLIITTVSTIISLPFIEIALKYLGAYTNKTLLIDYHSSQTWLILFLIILILSILSSIYPIAMLSRKRTVSLLASSVNSPGKKFSLSSILIILQFSISIFVIAGFFITNRQLNLLQKEKLGFKKENILIVKNFAEIGLGRQETFCSELVNKPGISSLTMSHFLPGNGATGRSISNESEPANFIPVDIVPCSFDYLKTFDIKLIAGEGFGKEFRQNPREIILNKTACRKLGFRIPLGEIIQIGNEEYKVVGIVQDYNYNPKYLGVGPLGIVHIPDPQMWWPANYLAIKFNTNKTKETITYIEKLWNNYLPGKEFDYSFFSDDYDRIYKKEIETKTLFSLFSILAIFISCLGLFAFVNSILLNKTKEIGIRKAAGGAKAFELIALLNKDFMLWVVIAFIIAFPAAWLVMHKWLENFAYKTELRWWIFALAGFVALGIALLTVSWQTWRAARRNPVESLRYE